MLLVSIVPIWLVPYFLLLRQSVNVDWWELYILGLNIIFRFLIIDNLFFENLVKSHLDELNGWCLIEIYTVGIGISIGIDFD